METNGCSRLSLLFLGWLLLLCFGCLTTQKKVEKKQPVTEVKRFEVYPCSLSSDGETPIQCERFGTGGPGTAVLFIGSMVGNESAGTPLLRDLSDFLHQNLQLTDGRHIILVPLLNPYGVANDIRENANGTYINSNFATESPALETILVKRLIYEHNPRLIVSVRQLGSIDPDGPPESRAIAETMARYCNLPIVDEDTTRGSLGYYAGNQKGIPVITFGLPRNAEQLAIDRLCGLYIKPLIAAALYPTELSSIGYAEPSCLMLAANEIDDSEKHPQPSEVRYGQPSTDRNTISETPKVQPKPNIGSMNAASPQPSDDETATDHIVTGTTATEPESDVSQPPKKSESSPVDAAPIIKTAIGLFQSGRYAEAQDEFQTASDIDPNCAECADYIAKSQNAASLWEEGKNHLAARRFEDAVSASKGVLSLNPKNADAIRHLRNARYRWAADLFDRGEYEKSKRLFEVVQAQHPEACPDCPDYLRRIADQQFNVLLKRGIDRYSESRYREAIQILEKATELAPASQEAREYLSKAHFQLAVEFCKNKNPASAMHLAAFREFVDCPSCQAMETALKKEYNQKGKQAFYNDQYEKAIADWELVRCLDPDYPEVETNIEAAKKIAEMVNGGDRE